MSLYDQMLEFCHNSTKRKSPLKPSPGPPAAEGNFLPFEIWKDNIPSHIHPPRDE